MEKLSFPHHACGRGYAQPPPPTKWEGIKGRATKALFAFFCQICPFCPLLCPPPPSGGGVGRVNPRKAGERFDGQSSLTS